MSGTLIQRSIEVLYAIYAQNSDIVTNVNNIYRATGIKNKNTFIRAYRHLQNAKLIRTKRTRKHSQKKVKVLTELGRSFIELKTDVYIYNQSYKELKQQVKQRFSPKYKADRAKTDTVKNILLPQIYNSTKSSEHKEPFKQIYLMMFQLSPQHNIDTILIRYIALISRPVLARNKPARDILNKIVIDLLSDQIVLIQRRELAEYITIDKEPFPNYLALNKFRTLVMLGDIAKLAEIRDINEKVKDVMYSIFNIIKTPMKEIPMPKDPDLSNVIQEMIHELGEENQTITNKTKSGSNSIC